MSLALATGVAPAGPALGAVAPVEAVVAGFDWLLVEAYGAAMGWLGELLGLRVLGYPFMQRAYLAAVCIAVVGPLVGSFLVHRQMAMIGDTLAHSAFAGVAVGLFVNATVAVTVSPLLTALVAAAIAALLVDLLVERAGAYTDTSLAIVLTGGFALGSVIVTATDGGIAVGINAYLFGSLATISKADVGLLVWLTGIVVAAVALAYRPLVYVTFDETGARAARMHARLVTRLLAVLTAVVVVAAMQVMGVILVAAMLVIPVAAAADARGFRRSIGLAVVAGLLATVLGASLSYRYDVAAGGAIVLVAIAVFLGAKSVPVLRARAT